MRPHRRSCTRGKLAAIGTPRSSRPRSARRDARRRLRRAHRRGPAKEGATVTSAEHAAPPTPRLSRRAGSSRSCSRHRRDPSRRRAAKDRRDPTELLTRAVQPMLWLLVFGQVFARRRAIPTGTLRYLDFLAPGVLAQSVLFTAIFYGIAVIWERDLGIVHKLLVSPAPRGALVLGKALAGGGRARSSRASSSTSRRRAAASTSASTPLAILGVVVVVVLGLGAVRHVLAGHRLPGEDARALHGHRAGADHAALLRQQRHLPGRR